MTIDKSKLRALAMAALEQQASWIASGGPWPQPNARLLEMQFALTPTSVLELLAELQGYQQGADAEAQAVDEARAEVRRLKAENAGLRTGYEAWERAHADLDKRAAYWKQRAKSAEGHLFAGDFQAAAMELHKYSRFESIPWPELTGSQHALILNAAGAVIGTVNRLRNERRPKDVEKSEAVIWCACGDGYPANSYGAGFMDANGGACENCAAARRAGEHS